VGEQHLDFLALAFRVDVLLRLRDRAPHVSRLLVDAPSNLANRRTGAATLLKLTSYAVLLA
jgi:hypothetical protein